MGGDFLRAMLFGLLAPLRFSATAARMRSFKAASLILSPSWMSMARLTFPSRLELNRPAGSFNAAPLANVILTWSLYVSPVQTMPPCDQTGVPGDVALAHFHSSTISGSASCMISRTFASVFPRQSASSLIFWSIDAEADSIGMVPFSLGAGPTFRHLVLQRLPHPCRAFCDRVGCRLELEFPRNGTQAQTIPTPTLPAFQESRDRVPVKRQ